MIEFGNLCCWLSKRNPDDNFRTLDQTKSTQPPKRSSKQLTVNGLVVDESWFQQLVARLTIIRTPSWKILVALWLTGRHGILSHLTNHSLREVDSRSLNTSNGYVELQTHAHYMYVELYPSLNLIGNINSVPTRPQYYVSPRSRFTTQF